jgi:hypothetical protein
MYELDIDELFGPFQKDWFRFAAEAVWVWLSGPETEKVALMVALGPTPRAIAPYMIHRQGFFPR